MEGVLGVDGVLGVEGELGVDGVLGGVVGGVGVGSRVSSSLLSWGGSSGRFAVYAFRRGYGEKVFVAVLTSDKRGQ